MIVWWVLVWLTAVNITTTATATIGIPSSMWVWLVELLLCVHLCMRIRGIVWRRMRWKSVGLGVRLGVGLGLGMCVCVWQR